MSIVVIVANLIDVPAVQPATGSAWLSSSSASAAASSSGTSGHATEQAPQAFSDLLQAAAKSLPAPALAPSSSSPSSALPASTPSLGGKGSVVNNQGNALNDSALNAFSNGYRTSAVGGSISNSGPASTGDISVGDSGGSSVGTSVGNDSGIRSGKKQKSTDLDPAQGQQNVAAAVMPASMWALVVPAPLPTIALPSANQLQSAISTPVAEAAAQSAPLPLSDLNPLGTASGLSSASSASFPVAAGSSAAVVDPSAQGTTKAVQGTTDPAAFATSRSGTLANGNTPVGSALPGILKSSISNSTFNTATVGSVSSNAAATPSTNPVAPTGGSVNVAGDAVLDSRTNPVLNAGQNQIQNPSPNTVMNAAPNAATITASATSSTAGMNAKSLSGVVTNAPALNGNAAVTNLVPNAPVAAANANTSAMPAAFPAVFQDMQYRDISAAPRPADATGQSIRSNGIIPNTVPAMAAGAVVSTPSTAATVVLPAPLSAPVSAQLSGMNTPAALPASAFNALPTNTLTPIAAALNTSTPGAPAPATSALANPALANPALANPATSVLPLIVSGGAIAPLAASPAGASLSGKAHDPATVTSSTAPASALSTTPSHPQALDPAVVQAAPGQAVPAQAAPGQTALDPSGNLMQTAAVQASLAVPFNFQNGAGKATDNGLNGGVKAAGKALAGTEKRDKSTTAPATAGTPATASSDQAQQNDTATPVQSGTQLQSGSQGQGAAPAPMNMANMAVHTAAANSPATTMAAPATTDHAAAKSTDSGVPVPNAAPETMVTLPTINTAKLVQSMGQSEMRVGMHSNEFGNISIRTSSTPDAISAQISLDHSELGKALAAHLPEIQASLGGNQGTNQPVNVRIDMNGQSSGQGMGHSMNSGTGSDGRASGSGSGSGNGSGSDARSSRAGSIYQGSGGVERAGATSAARQSLDDRLDIRI